MRIPHFMTLSLLASWVGLAIIGCTGNVDDDPAARAAAFSEHCALSDPDDPCAAEPSCMLRLCLYSSARGSASGTLTGRFREWELLAEDGAMFQASDGEEYEVWFRGDEGATDVIPDIEAHGEVEVWQEGGCDPEGGQYSAMSVKTGGGDAEVLLVAGSIGIWNVDGWTIEVPRDTTHCPESDGDMCNEFLHNRSAQVVHGNEYWALYQGRGVVSRDGYLAWVGESRSGSGEYTCMDGGGTEYDSWFVIEDPGVVIP